MLTPLPIFVDMAKTASPELLPCEALRPHVERYGIHQAVGEEAYRVLPGTGLVMGFQFTGGLERLHGATGQRLHRSGITGLQRGAATFRTTEGAGSVLVYFREAGAAAFFREPLHELFGQSLSLEHFMLRSELLLLEERLQEATTDVDRIGVVERFLLHRLSAFAPDAMVAQALALIHRSKGAIRMEPLAAALHTSRSPLERRFRKAVGATPKLYAGIVRMKGVLQGRAPGERLLDTALEAGFYDQAHFIKTFRTFTGETPKGFFGNAVE
jgi:AraC-like DNA-binding protein